MDQSDTTTRPRPTSNPPLDALTQLKTLQSQLAGLETPDELPQMVSTLSTTLDEVLAEHAGMADELLSLYEQLGIVFEVTRLVSAVQQEREVIDLFIENLRRGFEHWDVFTMRPPSAGSRSPRDSGDVFGSWLETQIQRACREKVVVVDKPPEADGTQTPAHAGSSESPDVAIAEVMVAPIFAGSALVCTIVLARSNPSPDFRASDMLLVESLSSFCGDLIRNQRLVREMRSMSVAMVRSLVSAVDQKDEYTCGHSLRVGYYATELGKRLKLREVDLQMLQWSALLHDVGKIGIRDDVLKKEGKLTEAEFAHIKEHPVRSHRVIQEVPQLADALSGILHHHEHWNGKGYPSGLKGQDIPLQARIIQMADMFDALTSNRSYRQAFSWERALEILAAEAGATVDPKLQIVFDQMIREQLEDDSEAWDRMVERAGRFAHIRAQGDDPEDSN